MVGPSRPKEGKLSELEILVKQHHSTLLEYGLATSNKPYVCRSSDRTLLEILEWISNEASEKAHDHPAVAKIWEAMAKVCDFKNLDQLAEAKNRFPHFQRAFEVTVTMWKYS